MISRCAILLTILITIALITQAQTDEETGPAGYEYTMKKRFRAEPVRFGKRAPREPVRFGKRSSDRLSYPFQLFNRPVEY